MYLITNDDIQVILEDDIPVLLNFTRTLYNMNTKFVDFLDFKWYNNNINLLWEIVNMSMEKQKLYKEIDTLPEELTNQVINFIEYLKLSYIESEAPESAEIKSKSDLKEKLQKGLDDIKQNRTYSLDEVFQKLDNL